ncbi:MAG TPA: toll/interleukin-1 receptor domain-containing protein [Allosphingosinicella sp.]|nr:toll/interleukin-1 receptor domain-containing protein [Allosphingosinicella sp.]
MKISFIGASVPRERGSYGNWAEDDARLLRELGAAVGRAGHEVVICSPYQNSLDVEILRGLADADPGATVEAHFPRDEEIRASFRCLTDELGLRPVREFCHPSMQRDVDAGDSYSWLLSQLQALDRAAVVITAGGRIGGSAEMLLHLAEAQQRSVLPIGYFGGAAAQSLERQQYRLQDRLGERVDCLRDRHLAGQLVSAAELLAQRKHTWSDAEGGAPSRFFISYARAQPTEADLVEILLRRRGLHVFRDEEAFGAGQHLPTQIAEHIHAADVFIALWSREYACSPWCFDELQMAIQRSQSKALQLWIFCLDDTRMVPPAARQLVTYPCRGRIELEGRLLQLLADESWRESN